MDAIEHRKKLIVASEFAMKQLEKLITQEIDLTALDPEKAKQAAQGKIEAIQGYDKILGIISDQTLIIEAEEIAAKGGVKATFSGVEDRIKK